MGFHVLRWALRVYRRDIKLCRNLWKDIEKTVGKQILVRDLAALPFKIWKDKDHLKGVFDKPWLSVLDEEIGKDQPRAQSLNDSINLSRGTADTASRFAVTMNGNARHKPTKLESLLDDTLRAKYLRVKNDKDLIASLVHIQNILPNYSSHRPDHSERIIKNLAWLIPENQKEKLMHLEIFLLLSSAWIHDVGMDDYDGQIADISDNASRDTKAMEFRKHHQQRSEEYINRPINYFRLDLTRPIAQTIGSICRAHDSRFSIVEELQKTWGPIRDFEKYGKVRFQLLAALLRLADACDLGYERVKEVLITVLDVPKNYVESLPHLEGALLVSNVFPEEKAIVVLAVPRNEEQERWVEFLCADVRKDLNTVKNILQDEENGIIIPYEQVILKKLARVHKQ